MRYQFALASPRRLLLVLPDGDDRVDVRARLVEVAAVKGQWRHFGGQRPSQISAFNALVERRARSRAGVVSVTLRAYHGARAGSVLAQQHGFSGTLRLQCSSWAEESANYARLGRVKQRRVPLRRRPKPSFLDELAEELASFIEAV